MLYCTKGSLLFSVCWHPLKICVTYLPKENEMKNLQLFYLSQAFQQLAGLYLSPFLRLQQQVLNHANAPTVWCRHPWIIWPLADGWAEQDRALSSSPNPLKWSGVSLGVFRLPSPHPAVLNSLVQLHALRLLFDDSILSHHWCENYGEWLWESILK